MATETDPKSRGLLVGLQQELSQRNRRKIHKFEQISDAAYASFEADYLAEVASYETATTMGALVRAVRYADLVFVGDYHTLPQCRKTLTKLLRRIRKQHVTVALELFPSKLQRHVDRFVTGKISLETLATRTKVKALWGEDVWASFEPIFELVRARSWRILAVDADPRAGLGIVARDEHMARRIAEHMAANPKERVIALTGEFHIATPHLPAGVRSLLAAHDLRPSIVQVYQNPEPIYWQLVDEGLEQDVEIVRIADDRFGVLNAPPQVVLQSYVNWIEYQEESLEYLHLERTFKGLVASIMKALKIKKQKQVRKLRVFGPEDFSFLDRVRSSYDLAKLGAHNPGTLILRQECSYFPEHDFVYLPDLAINKVGEVAAQVVHQLMSNTIPSMVKGFYPFAMCKALAFFGSKLLNHKRKAHHERYYRAILRRLKGTTIVKQDDPDLTVAAEVLLHKKIEHGAVMPQVHKIVTDDTPKRRATAEALGEMLGERLFYAYSRGEVTTKELKDILSYPLTSPEAAASLYFALVRRVQRTKIPRRL